MTKPKMPQHLTPEEKRAYEKLYEVALKELESIGNWETDHAEDISYLKDAYHNLIATLATRATRHNPFLAISGSEFVMNLLYAAFVVGIHAATTHSKLPTIKIPKILDPGPRPVKI